MITTMNPTFLRDGLHLLSILMLMLPFESFLVKGDILPISDLPGEVHGDVPEAPSAFSDGSFTNPSMPHFGLASAAVW